MKRLRILLTALLITTLAFAGKVSMKDALKAAQAFMPGEKFEVERYAASKDSKAAQEPFYIFNVTDGGGFVLVSGDDRTPAILGYSTEGNIKPDEIPSNIRYWLDSYTRQLAALDRGVPAVQTAKTRSALAEIEPMIKTRWDQEEPYNLMCPDGEGHDFDDELYDATNRCVTGCVATAVAQVMYYHQHPTATTAIPSYTSKTGGKKVTFAELPETDFDWTKMHLQYSSQDSDEGAWEVAKLMRYVGQTILTNYDIASNGGSGALIRNARMQQHLGYSKRMHTLERDYYSARQWEAMVYDELSQGRPLPYGGYSDDGGHQFVCDGYRDGLFHINWGWGGYLDGYFVISICDPEGEQGIGGGSGAFKYEQDAVFCFMPAEEDEEEIPQMRSIVDPNYEEQTYTRASATEHFTGISMTATYNPAYDYVPTETYTAEVGWGLYQGEQLIERLGSHTQVIDYSKRKAEWPIANELTGAMFGSAMEDGKYQLRQIFRKAGTDDDWVLMDNYGTNYLIAEISGNELTIRARSQVMAIRVNSISFSEEPAAGEEITVTVNITNEGETNDEIIKISIAEEGSDTWTSAASMTGYVGAGETGDVILKMTISEAGRYDVKVTAGDAATAIGATTLDVAEVLTISVDEIAYSCVPAYGKATIADGTHCTTPKVKLHSAVTCEGVTCQVKTIAEKAFRNNPSIREVVVPEGVETIKDYAFRYCLALERISLPSTLRNLGTMSIYNDYALEKVVSKVTEPFDIEAHNFQQYDSENAQVIPTGATLYVPAGTKERYQAIEGWTHFSEIRELPTPEKGDANGDGAITVTDAISIISYVLGEVPFDFFEEAADVNGDGQLSVTDAVVAIDMILQQQ